MDAKQAERICLAERAVEAARQDAVSAGDLLASGDEADAVEAVEALNRARAELHAAQNDLPPGAVGLSQ
jgi:hypothetical protein